MKIAGTTFNLKPKRHVRTADAARDARRWDEARRHYEAALADDPGLAPIWVQLGHARKELGDAMGAEAAYRRALSLEPEVADTHLQLGHLLKAGGRLDEAVGFLAAAARLQPGIADADRLLGELGYGLSGMRTFGARFSGPVALRHGKAVMWFGVRAKLLGLEAEEALRLQARDGLELGCTLHDASSAGPAGARVTARLEVVAEDTLHGLFVLPHGGRSGALLARVAFSYGMSEVGARTRGWMILDQPDDGLERHYAARAAGSA